MKSVFESLTIEYGNKDLVATLFGVILYTDEHPNIKKVLRDDDYWMSFNEITGDRFCVFSIRPKKGNYTYPKSSPGLMNMMVPIWREPSHNYALLELFDMEDTSDMPLLLLFTKVDDEYLTIELPLKDGSVTEAHNSITENLKAATKTLGRIHKANIKNTEGLYAAVSLQDSIDRKWRIIKCGVDLYKTIKELIP